MTTSDATWTIFDLPLKIHLKDKENKRKKNWLIHQKPPLCARGMFEQHIIWNMQLVMDVQIFYNSKPTHLRELVFKLLL